MSINEVDLCYGATSSLILEAIEVCELPIPHYIIANVGTELYELCGDPRQGLTSVYRFVMDYFDDLQTVSDGKEASALKPLVQDIEGLQLQEQEKQGPHKLSFYSEGSLLTDLATLIQNRLKEATAGYHVVSSIDPLDGRGLIDLLPEGVTKCYALDWWSRWRNVPESQIVFCGDSGNDLHALTGGYKSVVVANASEELKKIVINHHVQSHGHQHRLFVATQPATQGVLEGLLHFLH